MKKWYSFIKSTITDQYNFIPSVPVVISQEIKIDFKTCTCRRFLPNNLFFLFTYFVIISRIIWEFLLTLTLIHIKIRSELNQYKKIYRVLHSSWIIRTVPLFRIDFIQKKMAMKSRIGISAVDHPSIMKPVFFCIRE